METIKPAYEHSKLGNLMFNICAKISSFLYTKVKWLYWILQFTWGLLYNLVGLIISLILICCSQKPLKTPVGWRFEIGNNWGGCDFGIMYLRGKKKNSELDHTDYHEMGHFLTQNVVLGPLFPILVALPSAIRYWVRVLFPKKKWPAYDSFWAEDLATVGGTIMVKENQDGKKTGNNL